MSEKVLKLCLLLLCMGLLCAYRSPASAVPANKRWRAVRNKVPIDRSKTPKLFDLRGGNNGLGFGGGKPPSCSALTASHDNEPANSGNSQAAAGPFGFILSLLKRLVELYNDTINKYPMRTKVISSAVVGGLGDLLIQTLTRKKAGLPWGLDVRRFAVFTTVAGLYIAPVINAWFTWLTKLPTGSSSKFVQAAVMMLVDQTAGAVLINAGFFFAFELVSVNYTSQHAMNIFCSHNSIQSLLIPLLSLKGTTSIPPVPHTQRGAGLRRRLASRLGVIDQEHVGNISGKLVLLASHQLRQLPLRASAVQTALLECGRSLLEHVFIQCSQ